MTNTTTLGTVGPVNNLAHTYGAGSYQVKVTFSMFGLAFEAIRFVRTDMGIDNVELYIKHNSSWCSDFVKFLDRDNLCPAGRRALELLAVAQTDIPSDVAERFAQIELS